MAFIDEYNFEYLKNEAENIVINELERQLKTHPEPVCLCNDCVLDMAAMVLNVVKPLYRVSLLGTLYTANAMEEEAFASSLKEAVSDAIEKVRNNPSHDPEPEESEVQEPEEVPAEEVNAEEAAVEEVPAEDVPAEKVPAEKVPVEEVKAEEITTKEIIEKQ